MIGKKLPYNLKLYFPDMKIALIGSRGIPAKYGGFETFVQQLSLILSEAGHDVVVIGEKGNAGGLSNSGKIRIEESDYRKSKNPLLFYFNSLRRAAGLYDIILICGVGAAIFYPFFKSRNSILITNVDGLEHLRAKYSYLKKLFVRISQRFIKIFSDFVIADSEAVGVYWRDSLACSPAKIQVITYGAQMALPFQQSYLDEYGLSKDSYYLVVARLVPENHIREIIEGFNLARTNKKLLIVGGLDNTAYVLNLKKNQDPGVIFAGAIYNKHILDSLRSGAFAYLHGHSVGGTNPALLEAMAASCLCICHDNIFNHEVNSTEQLYFRNAKDLSQLLAEVEKMPRTTIESFQHASLNRVMTNYSWSEIGRRYKQLLLELYETRHHL